MVERGYSLLASHIARRGKAANADVPMYVKRGGDAMKGVGWERDVCVLSILDVEASRPLRTHLHRCLCSALEASEEKFSFVQRRHFCTAAAIEVSRRCNSVPFIVTPSVVRLS